MNASITLQRLSAVGDLAGEQKSWPLVIRAFGTNIPSEIFIYRAGKQGDPFGDSQFSCVASVQQLSEIPIDNVTELNATEQIPWYRTSQVELAFRTPHEAQKVWCAILEDVNSLVENFNLSNCLQSIEVVTINGVSTLPGSTVAQVEVPTPAGIGSPEGVVVATPGTTYLDTAAEAFWVKLSGTGNTGWQEFIQL